MPIGPFTDYGQGWVCALFLFPPGKAEWVDIRDHELGLPEPSPPPPPPPRPPPPPTMTQLHLDYNPNRITRIGRSQGPWGPASITSVVNKTAYTVELGIHVNNVVQVSTNIGAGQSTSAFDGRNPTADWVGVGAPNLKSALGTFEIHYRSG
jgi:hypothetical protein